MKNVLKKLVDFSRFMGLRYCMTFAICILIVLFVFDPPEVLYGFLLALNLIFFGGMFYFTDMVTACEKRIDRIEQRLDSRRKKVVDTVNNDSGK